MLRKPSPEHREAIAKAVDRSLEPLDLVLAGEMEREDTPEGVRITARIPTVVAERYGRYAVNGN